VFNNSQITICEVAIMLELLGLYKQLPIYTYKLYIHTIIPTYAMQNKASKWHEITSNFYYNKQHKRWCNYL